ncbi:hypothetical protein B0T17DRAFT_621319 [Bombardia bombarda]|uniref:Uncharacterized protein n=1 Tax=Bombardia bombarda TaxID=252184 RepID=A0AA39TW51_9PEZI|nr:hypothetical protein B0T17DRAFT_621319 [Bombardia bombarda]
MAPLGQSSVGAGVAASSSLWSPSPANVKRAAIQALSGLRQALVVAREDKECVASANANLCEKPAVSSQGSTWAIVGSILGILFFGTLGVLLYLHLRKNKREKQEDLSDQYNMADYGLPESAAVTARKPQQGQSQPKLSLDDLPGRPLQSEALPKGYVNPFVSPDDGVNDKAAEAGTDGSQWPKRDVSSQSSSQQHLPPQNR